MVSAPSRPDQQIAVNREAWLSGDFVREYGGRALTPAEALLLARYREPLSGRTLELGCGAGRVLGYLCQLGLEAQGVDLSPAMVEHCRRSYPRAHVRVGDICRPRTCGDGRYDAIWATGSVLDVLDDTNRRRVLREFAEMIGSNGILIFSSHNLDAAPAELPPLHSVLRGPWSAARALELAAGMAATSPAAACRRLLSEVARRRNHRALGRLAYRRPGYAVLNDDTHEYALLSYYIRRDDQERQLHDLGYALIECLDASGEVVAGGDASTSRELHYVAYPR